MASPTATYNPQLPTKKDWIRFDLNDRDDRLTAGDSSNDLTSYIHTDEEIEAVITAFGGDYNKIVDRIAGAMIRSIENQPIKFNTDGKSFDWTGRLKGLKDIQARAKQGTLVDPTSPTTPVRKESESSTVELQPSWGHAPDLPSGHVF